METNIQNGPARTPKRVNKKKRIIILVTTLLFVELFVELCILGYLFYQKENSGSNYLPVSQSNTANKAKYDSKSGLDVNLYRLLSTYNSNVLISPLSISTALMLAYNGADGNTATQFQKLLNSKSLEESNNYYKKLLLDDNSSDQDITISVANSIWLNQKINFLGSYVNNVKNFLFSDVNPLTTSDAINGWVSSKTNGKINQIISSIDPNQSAVLVNAVYFNGKWTTAFDQSKDINKNFDLLNGRTINSKFMVQDDYYQYFENDNLQSIAIPYGQSGQYQMEIYLPKKINGIKNLETNLTDKNLNSWGNWESHKGHIEIPKFKFETSYSLDDTLEAMGLTDAFNSGSANFDKISSTPTYISSVLHKTYIDVNEQGTEAAAVTSIGMMSTAAPVENPPTPFNFVANHPFIFIIRATDNNQILFIGKVSNPTS